MACNLTPPGAYAKQDAGPALNSGAGHKSSRDERSWLWRPPALECTERSRNLYEGKALPFLEIAESRNVIENKYVSVVKPECY